MITVETNFREQAKQKILSEKEKVKVKSENHNQMIADFIKESIADALCNFADQDNEFARSICEGKSFSECVQAVLDDRKDNIYKGMCVGINGNSSIHKAVNFYFPGAIVNFSMTINVNPHEAPATDSAPTPDQGAETKKKSVLELSLDDLF